MNFIVDFKVIISKLNKLMNNQINELKQETKTHLEKLTSKFPEFFDEFIELIDKIFKINFGIYQNKKAIITQHILNLILDIEAGKVNIRKNNIMEEPEELLFNYLSEKNDIKDINIRNIIDILSLFGFRNLLIQRIKSVYFWGQNKLFNTEHFYNIFSKMVIDYISIIKQDTIEFIEKNKKLLNVKIDKVFDYFIKYINSFTTKAINITEIINMELKYINKFKDNLMNDLKKLKNSAISKITDNFEQMMKNLEKECDEKINKIKSITNQKVNRFIDKYENKIFGYLNNMVSDENKNSKNKKTKKIKKNEKSEQKKPENNYNQKNKVFKKNEQNNNFSDILYDEKLGENKSYFINSKKYSDDEDSLEERYDIVDKEIREKDKKYNMKRINEYEKDNMDVNLYSDNEDSLEERYDIVDREIREKDKKYNMQRINQKDTNSDIYKNYSDDDDEDSLKERYNIVDKEIREKDLKYNIKKLSENATYNPNISKTQISTEYNSKNSSMSSMFHGIPILMNFRPGDALEFGSWIKVNERTVMVGLCCNYKKYEKIDFDGSIVGFDYEFNVVDTIYFDHKKGLDNNITYYENYTTYEGSEYIESIEPFEIILNKLPSKVHYLVASINSFKRTSFIKTNFVRIKLYTSDYNIGQYTINKPRDCIGLLLGIFERDTTQNIWYFRTVNETLNSNKITLAYKEIKTILKNKTNENSGINKENKINEKYKEKKDIKDYNFNYNKQKLNNKEKDSMNIDLYSDKEDNSSDKSDNIDKEKKEKKENYFKKNKNNNEEKSNESYESEEEDSIEKNNCSEFDKFDRTFGKKLDKKICNKASEFEQNMIKFVKNSKTKGFLEKQITGQSYKQKFDEIFESYEKAKEKGLQFLESEKVKNKCEKIDKYLNNVANSEKTEKVMNFFEDFNQEKYEKYLDKVNKYSELFDSETKEEFRDKIKQLLENEIYNLYEKHLEPKLKELGINLGKFIANKIGNKINKY